MKILFVCDHKFLTKDGKVYSNTFSYTILKRYVEVFSNVTVVARSLAVVNKPRKQLSSGKGINFHFLENISTLNSFFGLRQRHEKQIEKLLKEHNGVIVRLPSELGLLTDKIAYKINKKCLREVVGCAWDAMWNYGGIKSKVYAPYFFFKMKNSLKKSKYTRYVTENFLQNRYPSAQNSKTIALSDVELTNVDSSILENRINKIVNSKYKIILGTVASLTVRYKGIDTALLMLSNIVSKYSNVEYHILGEGNTIYYREMAEELEVSEFVFFDGDLADRKEVFKWFDSIDIYMQPSRVEGLPRSPIEAMSRACPVVASSVGGIPELLDDNMMFNYSNTKVFQDIIEELLNDKSKMLKVVKCNFNKAKKYEKSILQKKYNIFLNNFKNDLSNF